MGEVLRNERGHFLPGSAGGPGRRARPDLRTILDRVGIATDDELAAVARKLFTQARDGDVQAAALVLRHLCVAPAVAVELDVADAGGERIREDVARQLASVLATAAAGSDRLSAELACIALRAAPGQRLQDVASALQAAYLSENA